MTTVGQAKQTGDYHSSIKHVYNMTDDDQKRSKKRDRGLKLGVGNFSSGVLRLRKEDIATVRGRTEHASRGSRGRRPKK